MSETPQTHAASTGAHAPSTNELLAKPKPLHRRRVHFTMPSVESTMYGNAKRTPPPKWFIEPDPRASVGAGFAWRVEVTRTVGGRFPCTTISSGWAGSYRKARRQLRRKMRWLGIPRKERP
jgi:hypothetical protein